MARASKCITLLQLSSLTSSNSTCQGILPSEGAEEIVAEQAFQSYIGIVSSPPTGPAYDNFSREVNRYMQLPPFQFENPVNDYGGLKRVREPIPHLPFGKNDIQATRFPIFLVRFPPKPLIFTTPSMSTRQHSTCPF